jgi:hypothetical protein
MSTSRKAIRRRLFGCAPFSAAALLAAVTGTASATTPLRLDYCVESLGGGLYQYSFTLTLDNNDGSWVAGQGWDWLTFGDGQGQLSALTNWTIAPGTFPLGPWTEMDSSSGGHNGPTFGPVTNAYWVPVSVGDSLSWSGTSTGFVDQPQMLFSTLVTEGSGVHPANFEVAHRGSCGQQDGACCRPDGSCISVNLASCQNEGGVFRGAGISCSVAECPQPPTGACCRDSGCAIVSQAICTSTSGTYHGDNSTCAAAGCAAATAYLEGTDVGDVPSTAAVVNNGTGTLSTIHGGFNRYADADMYEIAICNPANFSANLAFGGIGEIALFQADGHGIAERFAFNGPATITNQFVASLPAGNYNLAVASFWNSPVDSSSQKLWLGIHNNTFDNIEYAPDGPGAGNPIDHWDQGGGAQGPYTITLTGACFVSGGQAACYANCDHSTGTPFLNVGDFTCFLQKFALGDPYANCDGSTSNPVLNVGDFTCFLQKFAIGCSAP